MGWPFCMIVMHVIHTPSGAHQSWQKRSGGGMYHIRSFGYKEKVAEFSYLRDGKINNTNLYEIKDPVDHSPVHRDDCGSQR